MYRSSKQYKKIKVLGQGGFGRASLIHDAADPSKLYVVKICNLEVVAYHGKSEDEQKKLIKMTIQEAELMKSIKHPNIVSVYCSFQEGSLFHIVMEYCDSGTLKGAIKAQRDEPFPEETIRRWTAQLAMALQWLHNKNILHRDVKPDNVFLTSNGRTVKLGDFGVAKAIGDGISSAYTMVGTATHMAPEMWQGHPYTFKSEVWALGVLLYELIALTLPFQVPGGANILALGMIICNAPIKPLPQRVSTEYRQVVMEKLLERDPDKRPDMAQVIGDPCIFPVIVAMTACSSPSSDNGNDKKAAKKSTDNTTRLFSSTPVPGHSGNHRKDSYEFASGPAALLDSRANYYWVSWSVTPVETMPFEAPSLVKAILTVPTIVDKSASSGENGEEEFASATPSIIAVCSKGELVAMSPLDNWSSVEWRCVVAAPSDLSIPVGEFKLFHAAYDCVTDDIFFTVEDGCFNQPYIFRANRRELMSRNARIGVVQLGHFISTSSRAFGISVDSKRRLLFACEQCANLVSIWQIVSSSPSKTTGSDNNKMNASTVTSARLMATITCVKDPWFVAAYFSVDKFDDEDCGGDQSRQANESLVKIAISRTHQNDVVLLQTKWAHFKERVLKTPKRSSSFIVFSSSSSSANGGSNKGKKIDDIFCADNWRVIAKEGFGTSLGAVYWPEEIIFDKYGNLFVADGRNKRIQIFSTVGGASETMEAVWASQPCTALACQVAVIAKHPRTGKPAALVSRKRNGNVIEFYY